jgi:hypothetical protein
MKSDNLAIARFSSSSARTTPDVALQTPEESEAARLYDYHLSLLRPCPTQQNLEEVTTAPIFTMPVVEHAEAIVDGKSLPAFPQYGLQYIYHILISVYIRLSIIYRKLLIGSSYLKLA